MYVRVCLQVHIIVYLSTRVPPCMSPYLHMYARTYVHDSVCFVRKLGLCTYVCTYTLIFSQLGCVQTMILVSMHRDTVYCLLVYRTETHVTQGTAQKRIMVVPFTFVFIISWLLPVNGLPLAFLLRDCWNVRTWAQYTYIPEKRCELCHLWMISRRAQSERTREMVCCLLHLRIIPCTFASVTLSPSRIQLNRVETNTLKTNSCST